MIKQEKSITLRCRYCEKSINYNEGFNHKLGMEYDGSCNKCKKLLKKLKSKERLIMRLKALGIIEKHK